MTLGYLVPEFPSQTHVFFWREIQALRASGARVVLFSTTKPASGSCRHEFASTAAGETTYLFPIALKEVGYLLRNPRGVLASVRYVFGLKESTVRQRLLLLGLIASAARLCMVGSREGVSHLHIHSCANAAHIGALSKIIGGIPYSLALHGDLEIYGTDHEAKMRHATFVRCVTRSLQQQVAAMAGIPTDRAAVLRMGVDLERFCRQKSRAGVDGCLRAITVARLTWPKGHEFALRALKQVGSSGVHVHYMIVGEGPYRPQIEADVQALELGGNVEFLGTRSEVEVAEELAMSDVLLLPSFKLGEAAPVAVMEAMAAGLPVIASIIGGTPDMISDGTDGFLVPQEDVSSIAGRLMELATDVSLRERIGDAARKRATLEFDSRVLSQRLLELISASGFPRSTDATIPAAKESFPETRGSA
jgi:colanic acid/amylovoran biosynthesis glycosyltransferase